MLLSVALFRAAAPDVIAASLIYLIKVLAFPVNATASELLSSTVGDNVGLHKLSLVVAVKLQVLVPNNVSPL